MQQLLSLLRPLRLSIVLAAVVAAAHASAAVISVPFNVTPGGSQAQTDWSYSTTLPQFDSTLGTLNSVTVSLDWAATLNAEVTGGLGSAPSSVVLRHYLDLYLTDGDILGPDAASVNVLGMTNLMTADHDPVIVGPGETVPANTLTGSGSVVSLIGSGAYDGLSTQTFWFWASASTEEMGSGSYISANTTFAGLKGSVTFDYTAAPVPEPTTIAAIGIGFLAIGRRRKVAR